MKNLLKDLLFFVILTVVYLGCNDTTTNPPPTPTADPNVVLYNGLIISERTVPFDNANSGVDLYNGVIVKDSSRLKDANLVDLLYVPDSTYYFRSGNLSNHMFPPPVPGYQTLFTFVNLNMTKMDFDSLKLISGASYDSTLTESNFTDDTTGGVRTPITNHSVYGFYLKGKFDIGVTPRPIVGVLYYDSSWNTSSGFQLKFDVKINKADRNKFVQY